jgi:hypothetical protein
MPDIEGGGVDDGAPAEDVDEAIERILAAEDKRIDAVLRNFSDFSGRGAATTGRVLYDIARDADEPLTVGEIVDRWIAQASGAALAHARRYADEKRRRQRERRSAKSPREARDARGFTDVENARIALSQTLGEMIRKGSLRRLDGSKRAAGLWTAFVVPGRPPRVHIAEGKVGPYDDAERERRERAAEGERARARGAGLAKPLEESDEAVIHRLAALAYRELAGLIEEANKVDPRTYGDRARRLLEKFAGGKSRLQLIVVLEECERELLRRGVREPPR